MEIYCDGSFKWKSENCGFGIYLKYCEKSLIKRIDSDIFEYDDNRNIIKCSLMDNNRVFTDPKKNTAIEYKKSNIRAEGYAILYTLIHLSSKNRNTIINEVIPKNTSKVVNYEIVKLTKIAPEEYLFLGDEDEKYTIYTDSEFWIKAITLWLPGWISGNKLMDKKNLDLVIYISHYMNVLADMNIKVEYKFVRGHMSGANSHERGNIKADHLAEVATYNNDFNISIIN